MQDNANASNPAVSVVIPAYMAAGYIAQALDSVFAQSFRDFEVIVVNDGSPDTPELERALQPYMAKITYVRQPNSGPSHARNTAIGKARAPLIALLDSDDFWSTDYLATQTKILEESPDADAVYSNAALFGDPSIDGKTYMDDVLPSEGDVSFLSLVDGRCNVLGPAMTFRRHAVERAGLYDEDYKYGEDFDLWLRLVKSGGRIVYHRDALYHLRIRPHSLSKHTVPLQDSVLRIFDKCESRPDLTADEREGVEQARRRVKAEQNLDRGKKALFEGEVGTAIRDIRAANEYYCMTKLRLVLLLMETALGLVRFLERMRQRF